MKKGNSWWDVVDVDKGDCLDMHGDGEKYIANDDTKKNREYQDNDVYIHSWIHVIKYLYVRTDVPRL